MFLVVHYIFFDGCLGELAVGGLIDLLYLLNRLAWFSQVDGFFISGQCYGLYGLGAHQPYYIVPVVVYPVLFEHMSNGIDQLVSQYGQIDMAFYCVVFLMVYRPDVQVCF